MKKYIAGFMVGVLVTIGANVFATELRSFVAEQATFDVYVQGDKFESDKPTVVIEGSTYLPLKATGEALGVPVVWNAEQKRVEVGEMNTEEKQSISPLEVSENEKQIASSAGIPLEIVPTTTPTKTSALNSNANEQFGSYFNTKTYYYKSDICNPDSKGTHPLVTYKNEQYVPVHLIGRTYIKQDGDKYYIQLPGKEPVHFQTGSGTAANVTENAYFNMGTTYIKLSSIGLKARFEGDTAFLEWAD